MPKYTTATFIQKAKKVHGDKQDYSLVEYKEVQLLPPQYTWVKRTKRYGENQIPSDKRGYFKIYDCGHRKWKLDL